MDVKNGSPDLSGDRNTTSDQDLDDADQSRSTTGLHSNGDGHGHLGNFQKSSNAKDPSRPRRKKARRACFACQRAHLTCGTLYELLCGFEPCPRAYNYARAPLNRLLLFLYHVKIYEN